MHPISIHVWRYAGVHLNCTQSGVEGVHAGVHAGVHPNFTQSGAEGGGCWSAS